MFDLFSVPDSQFSVLPKGNYDSMIVNVELKDSKAGGKYLNVEFKILSPKEFVGRSLFNMYNVVNSNEQAQLIGRQQLKELAKTFLSDDQLKTFNNEMLKGKQVNIQVDIKTDSCGDKNVIKKYKKVEVSEKAPW